MQKKSRPISKYIFAFILAAFIILIMPISEAYASNGEKAIILILDQISIKEMLESNTPNIDRLLENGAIGLMNTRTKSGVSNRGSAYLSLGMGVRTSASTQGGLAFSREKMFPLPDYLMQYNLISEHITTEELYELYAGEIPAEGEIINIALGDIERVALKTTPNNSIGLLGRIARENNLKIGMVGNSDFNTISREATMLAMDEKGIIPFGYVDSDLLMADTSTLGGVRLNSDRLLEEIERILTDVDILFIDYGDITRLERSEKLATDLVIKKQRTEAIERADLFLGQIMNRVNLEENRFIIISPNPSKEMVDEGNFALTPIIISGKDTKKGLLISSTTRREGLVTNFDFGPTLFNFFDIKTGDFIGENMKIVEKENPDETILKNQKQFLYIRKYRKVFHWTFIILAILCLIAFYLPVFTKWKVVFNKALDYLSLTTMAIPLSMMTVSLFGYKSIVLDIFYIIGIAFILALILNKLFKEKLIHMAILSLGISLFLLIDVYFIEKLMIISPLGSDAIAGGRFYGIGNDYMGILLGSSILGLFSIAQLFNIRKSNMVLLTFFYMFLIIIGLSPFFGANMGGTLSATVILLLILLIVLERKFSLKKTFVLLAGVIIGILLLAGLDVAFNPNPTHAGKALKSLSAGGWNVFLEIIDSKLRQVFWNLAHASWNIILFTEIVLGILLYKYKGQMLENIKKSYGKLYKGFIVILFGSIFVFLFNDTGTIAAALMLIYLFLPLGYLLNNREGA